MWYGATVRSTIPRGLIRSIGFDRHIDWSEFTVVTAADIPGENHIQLIVADQPCLADGQGESLRRSRFCFWRIPTSTNCAKPSPP
jgi:xanthine dehydrogenase molybdopterin-binding subunit B